jgi:hypothetical protein
MRVSCAYCVRNGLVAASSAAARPAVGPNSPRAAHQAAGTISTANSSDSACVASSEVPKTAIQTCSSE